MLGLFAGTIWVAFVLWLLVRTLRQFRAHRLTSLAPAATGSGVPSVSIVVPVRDEIANIGACLEGLAGQSGLGADSSITIVDDDSQDGTAAAVERAIAGGAPIRLAAAGPLPPGWLGKPYACWRGAQSASGAWLCFIDGDVRMAPDLVAAALATAEAQGIDMLSLQPFQELGSLWERLVFPAGLLMIACARGQPADDDGPGSAEMANGQFILIRRRVYEEIGGHAAIRNEICEDVALAARAKQAGYRFRVLRAEHLARTRMYRDFASLWEGLSKNAIEILGSAPATLLAAAAAFVAGWSTLLLPLAIATALTRAPSAAAAIGLGLAALGSAVVVGIQLGTARHLRIPTALGLLFALGYTMAAALACRGVLLHLTGRVTWKGRTYERHRKVSPGRS